MKPKAQRMHQETIKHIKKNDVQKRSAPGHPTPVGAGGRDRLLSRSILKAGRFVEPFGSPKRLKVMDKKKVSKPEE